MSKKKPLVSVVITNYNYGKYLRQAIESVLNQTYENMEIILIDDASTDGSKKIYDKFREKIHIIEHKKNEGVIFSRNEALNTASGDYLIFLDADDYWDEDYLEKLVDFSLKSSADICYTNLKTFGDDNQMINFPDFSLKGIISRNIVNMGALMKISAIKPFMFDQKLNRMSHEDWDFFLGLALSGRKFAKVPDVTLNYRIHKNHRNSGSDFAKSFLNIVKVNGYIIGKYHQLYPEKVEYTEDNEVVSTAVEQNVLIDKKDIHISDCENLISVKDGLIKDQQAEIERINIKNEKMLEELNSRTYIFAQRIARPFRLVKKIIGGKNVK